MNLMKRKKLISLILIIVLTLNASFFSILADPIAPVGEEDISPIEQTHEPFSDPCSWMKYIPDSKYLYEVNMPGTHDSGTKRVDCVTNLFNTYEEYAKCQNLNIPEQLNIGVRVFDLRLDEDLCICHGEGSYKFLTKYDQWFLNLYLVLDQIKEFLSNNPTETVIISVKKEDGDESTVGNRTKEAIDMYGDDVVYKGSSWPKMKDVRGKIVIMTRIANLGCGIPYSVPNGYSTVDGIPFFFEDHYNSKPFQKMNYVISALSRVEQNKIKNDGTNGATGAMIFTSSNIFEAGNIILGGNINPSVMASVVNQCLINYDYVKGRQYGFVMMDFVNENLARNIYRTNPTIEYRIRYLKHNSDVVLIEYFKTYGEDTNLWHGISINDISIINDGSFVWDGNWYYNGEIYDGTTDLIDYNGIVEIEPGGYEIEVEEITINNPPTKISYNEGEKFSPEGMVITLHKNNGTTEDVEYNDITANQFSFVPELSIPLTANNNEVTVQYSGKSVSQMIEVVVTDSITIKNAPTKTSYNAGEKFSPAGIVITLHKSNGTSEDVAYNGTTADKFSFVPTLKTPLTTNNNEVIVQYSGKSASQIIEITETYEINSITIKNAPSKTSYNTGEKFNPEGMVITLHKENGTTEDVAYSNTTANEFSFVPALIIPLTTHNQVIVKYKGKSASQKIEVKDTTTAP